VTSRPSVLIVDDHEETREMYAWCMRASGWRVYSAGAGEEAIFAAPAFHPDVIVMDLNMPGVDGFEAIGHLKSDERTRDIPVVVCTASAHLRAQRRAAEAGCVAFLRKPCLPDDLRRLLERVVWGDPNPPSSHAG
jgi:CheY-like chemotaxis protein